MKLLVGSPGLDASVSVERKLTVLRVDPEPWPGEPPCRAGLPSAASVLAAFNGLHCS